MPVLSTVDPVGMVYHGQRSEPMPSIATSSFKCRVCTRMINPGDMIVGFKNMNKRPPLDWEHCCAEICADAYLVPPREKSRGSPLEAMRTQISGVVSAVTRRAFGGPRACDA